ncbi:4-hydroxyphenylpyruvate dioxygenase [Pacificimonas flava]|uniref:4-hydroxyphenylpyruvate dioxygenase n=2 Tax=Pacificimonas TaxID=1960290 RepID=A0A219B738_9SPHN|nr:MULTISPECIES: 4-hydroxyphenylpyruvate dioxygenase [Pacificimonas]MBZ6378815.1 4-hydroxyphenylpyruvate dioxygenase [Pacificimonas aurantium]OWV33926.1 4-hydroxyphenylpyruvate dioxygenase [Pacificimonas flava]
MTDHSSNPAGLDGFEFLEFAGDRDKLDKMFRQLGFTAVAKHRSKDVTLYRQNGINFLLNSEPRSHASYFVEEHNEGACAMGWRVADAAAAYEQAIEKGAEPARLETGWMELKLPAIKGIGGSLIYFIDRFGDDGTIYDIDFEFFEGVDRDPVGANLQIIDHLTHNVYRGRMKFWAEFYEKLFNFREIRYFDIKGEYTGLTSKAMTAPDGKIRIPLNEESKQGGGQIEEFLLEFNGEGIQHIALATPDIYKTIDQLRENGLPFMTPPPETYYEMLEERLPGHGEPVDEMKARGLLLDGSTEDDDPRLLLQIFTGNLMGPVFFEIIQRKKDEGFGEGNFRALFESIERDQVQRGVLKVEDAETVEAA